MRIPPASTLSTVGPRRDEHPARPAPTRKSTHRTGVGRKRTVRRTMSRRSFREVRATRQRAAGATATCSTFRADPLDKSSAWLGSYVLTGEGFRPAKRTVKSSLTETRGTKTVERSTPDRGRTLFVRCCTGGRSSACVRPRSALAAASNSFRARAQRRAKKGSREATVASIHERSLHSRWHDDDRTHTNAPCPVSARPTIRVLISFEPSYE